MRQYALILLFALTVGSIASAQCPAPGCSNNCEHSPERVAANGAAVPKRHHHGPLALRIWPHCCDCADHNRCILGCLFGKKCSIPRPFYYTYDSGCRQGCSAGCHR